jgi:hypothetical protein
MSTLSSFLRFPVKNSVELLEPFDNILVKLRAVTAEFPPLYTRQWSTITSSQSLYKIRVMQFNMLAEGLSAHPSTVPPFSSSPGGEEISLSECGGFDTTHDATTTFNFDGYRKWRLLEEIERCGPDVLAMEECDHFHDFFEPALMSLGYTVGATLIQQ